MPVASAASPPRQNARMLSLANRAHGSITTSSEEGEVHVTILFADGERGAAVA